MARILRCLICGKTQTLVKLKRGKDTEYVCVEDFSILARGGNLKDLGIGTRNDGYKPCNEINEKAPRKP